MTLRRVAAAVAASALALGGLVACDSNPAVAAYVGETEFTTAEVDGIYQDLVDRQPDTNVTRQQILETLVVGELARSLSEQQEGRPLQVTAADIAAGENVPAESRYAQVRADMATHLLFWSGHVDVPQPTEEQLRELHELALAAGEEWADAPFEQLGPILNSDQVAQAIAVREGLTAEAERLGVSVNPRYAPLRHVFLHFAGGEPAVFVTLGEGGTDAVESGD